MLIMFQDTFENSYNYDSRLNSANLFFEPSGYLSLSNQIIPQITTSDLVLDNPFNSIIGETGSAVLNHNQKTISFSGEYENPIVFATSLSRNGGEPAMVRITDISGSNFTAFVEEPNYLAPGKHIQEEFSYVVLEAGTYELENGTLIEAGTIDSNATTRRKWETIDFASEFESTPIVLSQVQTHKGGDFVRTRMQDITADGLKLAMEEEEKLVASSHAQETIGYLAISESSGDWGDLTYQASTTGDVVTHKNYLLDFADFMNPPNFLAGVASYDGADSVGVRYRNLASDHVTIMLEEDKSKDAEIGHTTESVNFLAFSGDGFLRGLETFRQYPPNNLEFNHLWGLNNTGQTGGTADADIDGVEAWSKQQGSRAVTVAVIDSGIDYNHQDLAANMWRNTQEIAGNGIDDDGNGYIDDIYGYDFINNDGDPFDDYDKGHGTHVAGIIGAVGSNNLGVIGVSPNVSLMALKFLDADGRGSSHNSALAIRYAVDMGADIINASFGSRWNSLVKDAIEYANEKGVLFVASAGNNNENTDLEPYYPSTYNVPNVISVAATDDQDQLAWFSNYGATTVDLAAPGVKIFSTLPNNQYGYISGTSMAAPHVAGAAALLLAENPNLSLSQLKNLLLDTTDEISSLTGKVVTGGRLNVNNAISLAHLNITLTSPNGNETLELGEGYKFTWNDNISENVRLDLYQGNTFKQSITTSTPSDGSYYGQLPSDLTPGSNYRLKVSSTVNNTAYDWSDSYFSIVPKQTITVTSPNGGEQLEMGKGYNFTWDDNISENVRLDLYQGSTFKQNIAISTPSDGHYYWTLPTNLTPGYYYKLKVTSTTDNNISDWSNGYFLVQPKPEITVTSPNGGDKLEIGKSYNLTWNDNISENVRLDLYQRNTFKQNIAISTASDGHYYWKLPENLDSGYYYRFKVTSITNGNLWDWSNGYFSLLSNLT